MSFLTAPYCEFSAYQTNWDAPNTAGTTITPGVSNAKGSYADLLSGTVTNDCYGIWIAFINGASSGVATNILADIGVDVSGGTSYSVLIPNLIASMSNAPAGTAFGMGNQYFFPLFIKSGSRIACRAQESNASAHTLVCRVMLIGKPSRPELLRTGTVVEALGALTASSTGTVITSGVSNVKGAYTSLGAPTRNCFYIQMGMGMNDATMQDNQYLFDLAVGDVTNKHPIYENLWVGCSSGESVSPERMPMAKSFCTITTAGTVYTRAMFQGATADDSPHVAAYCVSGSV